MSSELMPWGVRVCRPPVVVVVVHKRLFPDCVKLMNTKFGGKVAIPHISRQLFITAFLSWMAEF